MLVLAGDNVVIIEVLVRVPNMSDISAAVSRSSDPQTIEARTVGVVESL